jgi:hypothetical protein
LHTHRPDAQVSFDAVQSRQVDANAPHCVSVGVATQVVASAQQPPQKRMVQTQLPLTHSRPGPHASLLPHLHWPPAQLSALPAVHGVQAVPSVAHPIVGVGVLQVCGVLLPLQQPVPLHVVEQGGGGNRSGGGVRSGIGARSSGGVRSTIVVMSGGTTPAMSTTTPVRSSPSMGAPPPPPPPARSLQAAPVQPACERSREPDVVVSPQPANAPKHTRTKS